MNRRRLSSPLLLCALVASSLVACSDRQDLLARTSPTNEADGSAGAAGSGGLGGRGPITGGAPTTGAGAATTSPGTATNGGGAGSASAPPTEPPPPAYPTSCAPNVDGGAAAALREQIIACGLSPQLRLGGADADGVAFFDRDQGDLRRLDRATGTLAKLRDGALVYGSLNGPAILDGRLFFFDFDRRLRSIHLRTGQERSHGYANDTSAIVFDETYAYVGSQADWDAPTRIGRLPHGKAWSALAKTISTESADPTAVDAGFVYFFRYPGEIRRLPTTGGPSELVFALPALPPSAASSARPFTVAGGRLYFVRHGGKGGQHHVVSRPVAPDATSEETLLTIEDGDCGCGPTRLRVEGGVLLIGSPRDVLGVPLSTPSQARRLFSQPLAHDDVVVDGTFVYGAFTRGGVDTPIEGYIARVPHTLSATVIP